MKFHVRFRRNTKGVIDSARVRRIDEAVRTRFAPSPTGFMHVGNVRTAIYAWLFARQNDGTFVLRIEDTDKEREVEGAIGHLMETLKWLGISWDESIDVGGPYGPYIQSERLPIYRAYAKRLLADGHAYPDPYTEAEVEGFRTKAEEDKKPFLYREHRPSTSTEWDGKAPLRFKVPEIKRYSWHDLIMGDLSAGEEALDDFIMIKSDGYPTYNFAHIVDDIEMRITHVMRGQEYVSSTPKYLSVYEALGVTPPAYATLPHILGTGGAKKLSKRDGAKDLLEYRAEGYLPEAMVNFLALLGWHPTEKGQSSSGQEPDVLSVEDLLREFDIERVQKSGAQFDEQKLLFLNREWMRRLTEQQYIQEGQLMAPTGEAGNSLLERLVPLLKERAHTFKEARDMLTGELQGLFVPPSLSAQVLLAKEVEDGSTGGHLQAFLDLLVALPPHAGVESIKDTLMPYANSVPREKGGRGASLWPLRYSLSGQERSPDPFTLIWLLGKEESVSRIQRALGILGS